MIKTLDCPNCGAPLDNIQMGTPTTQCKFCHTNVLLPTELSNPPTSTGSDTPSGNILEHAQDIKRMVEFARSGKQIEAIRIFREVFAMTNGVRAMAFDLAGNLYTIDYMQLITRYHIN